MTTPPTGLPSDDQVARELRELCELLRAAEAEFADLKTVQADLRKLRATVKEYTQRVNDLFGKAGVTRSKEEIAALREVMDHVKNEVGTLKDRQDAAEADRREARDTDRKETRQALVGAGKTIGQLQSGQEELASMMAGLKEELARTRRAARCWLGLLTLVVVILAVVVVWLGAFGK